MLYLLRVGEHFPEIVIFAYCLLAASGTCNICLVFASIVRKVESGKSLSVYVCMCVCARRQNDGFVCVHV